VSVGWLVCAVAFGTPFVAGSPLDSEGCASSFLVTICVQKLSDEGVKPLSRLRREFVHEELVLLVQHPFVQLTKFSTPPQRPSSATMFDNDTFAIVKVRELFRCKPED